MSKPREFWIIQTSANGEGDAYIHPCAESPFNETHVIEYSAYEQVVKERDELAYRLAHANEGGVQVTMKLNTALEALKKIGTENCSCSIDNEMIPMYVAREAIAKIEGMK